MNALKGLPPHPTAVGALHNCEKDALTAAKNGGRAATTVKVAGSAAQDRRGDLRGQLNQRRADSATSRPVALQIVNAP